MTSGSPTFGSILVMRTDRLGDVVLILPFLEALANAFPTASIDVLVRPLVAGVFHHQPRIRNVILDEGESCARLAKKIAGNHYDALVAINPTWRNAWVAFRSRVPWRVGQGARLQGLFFNHPVTFHRSQMEKHEAAYHLLYLRGLGVEPPDELPDLHIAVDESARNRVASLLKEGGITGERALVVLHPGLGGSSHAWGKENYRALASRLHQAGCDVVVTGSPAESELASFVAGCDALSFAGRTSLAELIALIALSRLFISVDTGPMHVAAALGVPTVSIFSPQRGNAPVRWAPIGNRSIILRPEGLSCGRCGHDPCPDKDCMKRVTLEQVEAAARELLGLA